MLIAIDAGHGRYTPGKRCLKSIDPAETREWILNDRVADRLERLLQEYDCTVLRIDDTTGERDIPLRERSDKANAARADVYLSIHHNAGIRGGSGGGIVAIVAMGEQPKSEIFQRMCYDHLIRETGLRGNRSNPMYHKDLHVLRETDMPAVLVECGYMDSTTDTPQILTTEHSDQCAKALCDALVEYGSLPAKGHGKAEIIREGLYEVLDGGDTHHLILDPDAVSIEMVDEFKTDCGTNFINAGYFSPCKERDPAPPEGDGLLHKFTLPVGHLVADYKATDKWTRWYCERRGKMSGDKLRFPANWGDFMNPLCGNAISTFYIAAGKAGIEDVVEPLPNWDYAVSGIALVRGGKICGQDAADAQGWDASPYRPTWHSVVALSGDGKVHLLAMQSRDANLMDAGELGKRLLAMGMTDALKLDGGGSFRLQAASLVDLCTAENRRICSILRFRLPEPEQKKPTAAPWYESVMQEAKELGLMDGTRPEDTVTRAELAAVAVKLTKRGD